jgi:hypothetical protein
MIDYRKLLKDCIRGQLYDHDVPVIPCGDPCGLKRILRWCGKRSGRTAPLRISRKAQAGLPKSVKT